MATKQSYSYPTAAVTVPGGLDANIFDSAGNPLSSTGGALDVNVGSFPLPTGASTAALQTTGNSSLSTIVSDLTNGTQVTQITGTVPLPTGAATEATLSSLNGKVTACNTGAVVVASSALPTGAATESTLAAMSAKLPATLGQKASSASLAVVLASDQSSIPVTSGANTNGANTDSTVSTVATLTAPANSVGFVLMNLDTSSANIRWRIGATATSSAGQQLQPGRDTGYVPCGANISICAESGTQNYNIQWILSS